LSLDSQTAALLRELGLQPEPPQVTMMEIGVQAAREGSRAVFHAYAGEGTTGCHVEDVLVPGAEVPIPARLYRPAAEAWPPSSMVVFLHGGGWSMGDLDCYDFFMRDLCVRSATAILSVEYRLAPEHKYPAQLDDGLAAVRWAAARVRDPARIAVMGDSAGGNLAAVVARRLHIEGRIRLAGQLLLYPMLDVSQPHAAFPSRMRYGDGEYLLTRESIDTAATWYLDGIGRRDDPDVSPLLVEDLSVLPETVIVIGGHDPLLDEARQYAERLRAAGVATDFKCFATTIHAFLSFGVLDVAREGRAYLAGEIKRLLQSQAGAWPSL
jgi:acetyl esterase